MPIARRLGAVVASVGLLAILALTLYPNPRQAPVAEQTPLLCLVCGETGGADVALPMLLLHGEQDALCPVEGSRRFHADLRVHGSALRCYPELRHEIFNEPEAEQVFADLLRWVESLES